MRNFIVTFMMFYFLNPGFVQAESSLPDWAESLLPDWGDPEIACINIPYQERKGFLEGGIFSSDISVLTRDLSRCNKGELIVVDTTGSAVLYCDMSKNIIPVGNHTICVHRGAMRQIRANE